MAADAIADYHFELSEHADMRWPLSPNFEKLLSRTAFRGKARWTVPYVGLLNPDTAYYWRVRARDEKGFTASDIERQVFRGKGFVRSMEEYEKKRNDAPDAGMVKTPANLIARAAEPSLRVVGADLKLPSTNKAFYRVVAIVRDPWGLPVQLCQRAEPML